MLVTAVVLSFNSESHIGACLRSLAAATARLAAPCEIYVVDNGSTDSSRAIIETLRREHPGLIHGIFNTRNLGTTVARNLAFARARGRYLLVVDSDVVVPEETLPILIATLEADPDCALVAPRLIFPDGRPQLSTDRFPSLGRKIVRLLFLRHLERNTVDRPAKATAVDYAIAAFWLARREVLDVVGPLDERFFYAPEDADFCLSIWLAGYRVLYVPRAHAIHDARELSRRGLFNRFALHHLVGLARYFLKHRYVFGTKRLRRRIARAQRTRAARASGDAIPET